MSDGLPMKMQENERSRLRRFCMVTTFFPPYNFGGDGIFVYRLANALARRGHQVDVVHDVDAFTLMSERPPSGEYPLHPNVSVQGLALSQGSKLDLLLSHQLGRAVRKRDTLKRLLANGAYDVIHFHNISLMGGPQLLHYGESIKLCTTHDHWFVCAMHVLWRFDREPCSRRSCLACTLHGRRPPQWWRRGNAFRQAIAQVDAFIAPSAFARVSHLRNGFPAEMQVIPYFMPEDKQRQIPHATRTPVHERPYFLFVGRLEKIKGVQQVIAVFQDYEGADLLIAGTGTYEESLRSMATGLSHIHFLGFLSHEQLRPLYDQAIAVIVPSIGFETFGWITLEAFAARTAVIAHDLGALAEVVAGGGGFVYRTPEEMVQAMERLRSEPALREEMGERGYQTFRQKYGESRHLEMYFDLIDRIAEKRAR